MDCFDTCGLIATVEDGKVTDIKGDKNHPVTQGHVCSKGKKLLERLYHPKRLTHPMAKRDGIWKKNTWDEAIETICEKLSDIKSKYKTTAVLNYAASGYGGIIKSVDQIFFNYYGGVTTHRGSLCWGAGLAAQRYDFGDVRGHHPEDIAKAKTILIWGRNPADTNVHLMRFIVRAKKEGATIIQIDPTRNATSSIADIHIPVHPSTDGALALGIACEIIRQGWVDKSYIEKHVLGFNEFRSYAETFTLEKVEAITGILQSDISRLADIYANQGPSCIIVGLGMQRYTNGGETIRCIDALGAITGHIGKSGGGVNYGNFIISPFIDTDFSKSRQHAAHSRSFVVGKLAEGLETADDPPIKLIFVSKANPLVQCPNVNKTINAFNAVDFKITVDMFMTDTARYSDMVLPCTSVLEEEDVIFSNMFTPYLNYSEKVVNPPEGVISEYDFFQSLAMAMGMRQYPFINRQEFIQKAIRPLTEAYGIDVAALKQRSFTLPDSQIPWEDGNFKTPSQKYELYSEKAAKDGFDPLPVYIETRPNDLAEFPIRLITPHHKDSLHSQHFAFYDEKPVAHVHPETLVRFNLKPDGIAIVRNHNGEIGVRIKSDDGVAKGIAIIHQGYWHNSGSVNMLTSDNICRMGEQAAFYDCFCRLDPV